MRGHMHAHAHTNIHTHTQFDHLKYCNIYNYIKCAFHFSVQFLFEAVISLVFTQWGTFEICKKMIIRLQVTCYFCQISMIIWS